MSAANEIKLPLNCSHKIRGLGLGDSTILYAVDPQRPSGQKEYAVNTPRTIPRSQEQFAFLQPSEDKLKESSLKKTMDVGSALVPSVGVKEGVSCVIFRAIVARKTPNLALPSLQHSVYKLRAENAFDVPHFC